MAVDHIKIKEAILQNQITVVNEYRQIIIMTLDVPPCDRMRRNIHMKATQHRTLPPPLPSHQALPCQNTAAVTTIHTTTQREM